MTDDRPIKVPVLRVVQQGDVLEPEVVEANQIYTGNDEMERKRYFLGALAETGSVSRACQAVGISRIEAHQWRKDPFFERGWNEAYRIARTVIVDAPVDRAINGALRPIFCKLAPRRRF